MSSGPPPPPPPPPPHDDEDDYEASVSNRFARDVGALVGLALLTTALMRHTWSLVRWHRAHAAGSGKFHERLFRFLLAAHLVWSLHCVLIFARGTMTLQTGRNWSSGQLACEIAARLVSSLYTSGYACLGFFFGGSSARRGGGS